MTVITVITLPLQPVISVSPVPARGRYRTVAYLLALACGHLVRRGFRNGPIPKSVRCRECVT